MVDKDYSYGKTTFSFEWKSTEIRYDSFDRMYVFMYLHTYIYDDMIERMVKTIKEENSKLRRKRGRKRKAIYLRENNLNMGGSYVLRNVFTFLPFAKSISTRSV